MHSLSALRLNYICAVLGDIFSLFLADLCDGFGFGLTLLVVCD